MSKKKKYYVVWKGVTPGIYDDWNKCKHQVQGYEGAMYKSYKSLDEATEAFRHGYTPKSRSTSNSLKGQRDLESFKADIISSSICVDAACSGNPGDMEYRGVTTFDKTELFRVGPIRMGTNNIGEFLAIVHALAMFKKLEDDSTTIYTDSKTAMAWIRKKKANTKLFEKHNNPSLKQLVLRGEQWLKANPVVNPILKWDTENWGEIPADFGRK